MSYIDLKYIRLIGPRLDKFKEKDTGKLFNFRCPFCGDSTKNKNRARGFLYPKNSDFMFKCHNCGLGMSFPKFLEELSPALHKDYVMERFVAGTTGRNTNVKEPKYTFEAPTFDRSKTEYESKMVRVCDLNSSHPSRAYLQDRDIPEEYFCDKTIYYTDNFSKIFYENSCKVESDPRVVFTLIDENENVLGFQGRSILPESTFRYLNFMLDSDNPKLYGLHHVNTEKPVYVCEGIFDSLFLSNSVAMCGSDVSSELLKSHGIDNPIYVLDNEPRNKEIVKKYEKLVESGNSVVIWPSDLSEKDINDMVLNKLDPMSIIEKNTYSGLEAKIKLSIWKKV